MGVSVDMGRELDYSWLHDDVEEDLVGAEWHQHAIRTLSTSLTTLAEARGWPWHVGDQVTLAAWKPNNEAWRPAPDILIYPRLGPTERQEIDVRAEGPPAFIVEVASASTWAYDVSMEREGGRPRRRRVGKARAYLVGLRVPEYLVFDPRSEFLAGQVPAWRRVGDAGDMVEEWLPEPDGRYQSRALGISLRPDGPLLRVLDPDGRPVPYWFEATRENAALRQENAARRRENAAQAQRIAALEAEVDRLGRLSDQETS